MVEPTNHTTRQSCSGIGESSRSGAEILNWAYMRYTDCMDLCEIVDISSWKEKRIYASECQRSQDTSDGVQSRLAGSALLRSQCGSFGDIIRLFQLSGNITNSLNIMKKVSLGFIVQERAFADSKRFQWCPTNSCTHRWSISRWSIRSIKWECKLIRTPLEEILGRVIWSVRLLFRITNKLFCHTVKRSCRKSHRHTREWLTIISAVGVFRNN